jgi:hypothetical protein
MLDPMIGRVISPLTTVALCVKPRGQMTTRQVVICAGLELANPDPNQLARNVAARGEAMQRLAGEELLRNLPLLPELGVN